MLKQQKNFYIFVLIISIFVIFSNLGGFPLLDPDEPVYAETPKEMILHNEFLSPRIYGEYWYDKPPMYYWLVSLSYHAFGINDFAARFPSALLALGCVLVVMRYGKKLFNERVGMTAALILVTSFEFFYLGKAAVTDMTLTFCLTVSLLAFLCREYWLFYLFSGLAVVTKGPIGLFFPAVIAFCYLLTTRNFKELRNMKIPQGLLLFLAVALPWFVFMYHTHGSAFVDTFLGFHNVTRFTSPEHPSGTLWYYYIPVLLIGFFPWTPILLQSIYASITRGNEKVFYFLLWIAIVFAFFTISQTKLVSYILPLYPPMALLTAWYIHGLTSNHYANMRQTGWIIGTVLMTGLLGTVFAFSIKEVPELKMQIISLIAVLVLVGIGTVLFLWKKQIRSAFNCMVLGMTAFTLVLVYLVLPAIAPLFSVQETSQYFMNHCNQTTPVYVSKFLRPGFSFYTGVYGTELPFSETSTPDLGAILNKEKQAYFVLRDLDYKRIPAPLLEHFQIEKEFANKLILSKK